MTDRTEEPVRLPGIINMEMEADKLDPEKVRNLRLNIPLRISVDSCSASLDGGPLSTGKMRQRNPWVSPSAKINMGRSESVEARQRKRTRDWLEGKMGGGRVRSASAGRDKRTEMAARYWAVLFENLRRAVDDLYRTCEGDESCIASREVVMVLENYTKDFKNLINWLRLKIEYENTPQPQRPTSLTWDIRKTSPLGKMTPASTPGKLTPTRQLLLCSPAKRQLNFDENSEGTTTRSRQVSETIKEVGLELENSPHSSSLALDMRNLPISDEPSNGNFDETDNCSEHEKSDSEQEKDTPVVEVVKELAAEACAPPTVPLKDSQQSVEAPVNSTLSTELDKKQASKADSTPEKKVKGKLSKVTETRKHQSGLTKTGQSDKVGGASGPSKGSTEKVSNVSKVGLADKVSKGGTAEKCSTAGNKTATDKPGLAATSKPGNFSASKLAATTSDKGVAASRREKSTEKPKPQSKPTSFANTVKTTLTKPSTLLIKQAAPRMTRALTTITAANKPKLPSRKTAAGLLITTTPAARASPPLAKSAASQGKTTSKGMIAAATGSGSASGSPKQQRISLVARQAKFASENKNPNRSIGGKAGPKARPTTAPSRSSLPPNPTLSNPIPHGSTTSLSSGSSGRSWADTVRGGPLPGLHCSAEDLSCVRARGGSMVDSEGWCTVRRARARFSPSSNSGAAGLTKGRNSTGKVNRAKNRFKMPSSAMSMPSLAFGDEQTEESEPGPSRPVLEKSSSSASILRNGREKGQHLGKLVEKPGGSSAESLSGSDPSKIKMKKDQINLTKKKALKKSQDSTEDEGESKHKVKKTKSCPEAAAATAETDEAGKDELKNETDDSKDKAGVEVTDIENEEIEMREKAIAQAEMEVSDLQREIKETEQAELTDTDCDNDQTDTDNYTTDTDTNDTRSEVGAVSDIGSRYEALLEGLSWAEQLELEEQIGDPSTLEARLPGRAIQLHEKLSSPARKREPHETFKHYQEKQDKARLRRLRFTEQKASKLTILNMKIEEVIEQRDRLVDERKGMIEHKLKKAEEKRIQHIEGIRKKAHKEEEKLKEIAFINELQAQNTRMDMMNQVEHADENCEERLAEIAGERAKKAEQREEREAKAEERRRAMEEERQKQKNAMIERRREGGKGRGKEACYGGGEAEAEKCND